MSDDEEPQKEELHDQIALIGETAGTIWKYLFENGAATQNQLIRNIEAPRDLVLQAIGWLAREGKLLFDRTPRSRSISLR
ncbi:MAG: winged helix-turn-helix domain-containing protein [Planctomycetaceae bacterium]|nr:winged helix-turn-helix domain-containing protein [Planctomycetaceae bacterium]